MPDLIDQPRVCRLASALGLACLLGALGCRADDRPSAPSAPAAPAAPSTPAARPIVVRTPEEAPYSNIHRRDYVGPEVCGSCHKEKYEAWRDHPHSAMNADATPGSVVGDFSGRRLAYGDGEVEFDRRDGHYTMTLLRRGELVRRFRVTRTVGSRLIQMYMGVQTEGPEPATDAVAYSAETKLPFAWWVRRKEWFPETYDELPPTPEYDAQGQVTKAYDFVNRRGEGSHNWKANCIRCHNTYPYALRLRPGRRAGFPRADLRVTKKLPPAPTDSNNWAIIEPNELITLGISCESCHFGGREHAEADRPIRFLPSGEGLHFPKATPALIREARDSPYVINGICRQCHSAVTPRPNYPDGSAIWGSREALDMDGGACVESIRCTDCHDPHQAGPDTGGGPDDPHHLRACVGCHPRYQDPKAAARHAGHPLDAEVSCLDCHMPRLVHGLQDIVRTHRISSPTDPRMYGTGAPNACNLCHLDKSVLWTLAQLKRTWGVDLPPDESWKPWYGGSLKGPAALRWLRHKLPIVRLVAADAFARSKRWGPAALPSVLGILEDVRPPNRLLGQLAVERILGRRLTPSEYSAYAPPAVRARQVAALRKR